mmetsp:Transcript_15165/g.34981  ORF Transcript_15165/g.34981 Transcript_15165/m.34981 type:complete len:199 (-) Transcript_15165:30-626(-)
METLSTAKGDTPDLVANLELMQILRERTEERRKENRKKPHPKLRHRDWIEDQVLQYLVETSSHGQSWDTERLPEMVATLRKETAPGFGLTDAEVLQVLNFMPREAVEIHLMLEDLSSRMSEDRQAELLAYIESFLKKDAETTTEEDAEEIDEDDGIEEVEETEDGEVNGYGMNGYDDGLEKVNLKVNLKNHPPLKRGR